MAIKWPKGKVPTEFYRKVHRHAHVVLTGHVLTIDPASGSTSAPGYAIAKGGQFLENGTIELPPRAQVQARLAELWSVLTQEFEPPDVLVIERLRGAMVSNVLHWSAGVTVAAVNPPVLIECPIVVWKAVAKTVPSYRKTDAQDATMLLEAVLQLARQERNHG